VVIGISTADGETPNVQTEMAVSVAFLGATGEDGEATGYAQALIGPGAVHYVVKGRTFRVSAGSFFQVNLAQAETLVDLALARLGLEGDTRALDLYSGVGLFTAFMAERAGVVTAIEAFPGAVADAAHNLAAFENVNLVEGTVEDALARLGDKGYDVALLDPPRAGMEGAALDALAACGPTRIVYVSCDPATLARDIKRLAGRGYRVVDVQPVDMFPQTYHIEAVALLERA
jgi:23S rRNA (uracil1939-C5)-methyltransferase